MLRERKSLPICFFRKRRSAFVMLSVTFIFITLALATGMCIVLTASESPGIPAVNENIYVTNIRSFRKNNEKSTSSNISPHFKFLNIANHENTHDDSGVKNNFNGGSDVLKLAHLSYNNMEGTGTTVLDNNSKTEINAVVSAVRKRSVESSSSPANVSSGFVEPYDLAKGPLSCEDVWPFLRKKDKGKCKLIWKEGSSLPDVLCALIGGYKPIAGSYTTLIYTAATYHIVDTPVGNVSRAAGDAAVAEAAEAARGGALSGGRCAYQTRFELVKVESLSNHPGVPVRADETLLQIAQSESGPAGGEGDTQLALVSQGLKSVRLDLRPGAIGAKGAMFSVPPDNCTANCSVDVWVIAYAKNINVVHVYMNRAWRVTMEFNPAFMKLATFLLHYLRNDAYVEELLVHGGERWDDGELLLAPLTRLRKVDFSSNGLATILDVNFQRMPGLTELNLSNNNLATVPRGISLLKNLRSLDLSNNPLAPSTFATVLRPLRFLRSLNVSFTRMGGLEPLDDPLEDDSANGNGTEFLPLLEELDARASGITNVSSAAARRVLRRHKSLQRLLLSGNLLGSPLPPDLVEDLPALRELALASCGLQRGPALRLAPQTRLHLLDLSRNELDTPEDAIAPNATGVGVSALDMSSNPLRRGWGAHAFDALRSVAFVNLSRCGLAALTADMLKALEPLHAVDLGFNPIDCNQCSTLNLRQWLTNRTQPVILTLGRERALPCIHPPVARGRPVLEALQWPSPQACRAGAEGDGWNGAAVAGAIVGGALLAAGILALLALRFRLELVYVLHVLRANRAVKAAPAHDDSHVDDECEFDAFVCYSKYDRAWVLGELLPRLEGSSPRYRLCLHERDFPLGSLIVQNIVECMARSRRTLIVLTRAFIDSQWCQWELEMATHRLLDGSYRDYLVLVELERLEARALPRLLRMLVETRTFLQWPTSKCAPAGCCGRGVESAEEIAWRRLRAALGPPLRRTTTSTAPTDHPTPADKSTPILATSTTTTTTTETTSPTYSANKITITRQPTLITSPPSLSRLPKNVIESQQTETNKCDVQTDARGEPEGSWVNNSVDSPLCKKSGKILHPNVPRKRNSLKFTKSKDLNACRIRGSVKACEDCNLNRTLKECNKQKCINFPVIRKELNENGALDDGKSFNNGDLVHDHNIDASNNITLQQNALNILKNNCVLKTPISQNIDDSTVMKNYNTQNLSNNIFVINLPEDHNTFDVTNQNTSFSNSHVAPSEYNVIDNSSFQDSQNISSDRNIANNHNTQIPNSSQSIGETCVTNALNNPSASHLIDLNPGLKQRCSQVTEESQVIYI